MRVLSFERIPMPIRGRRVRTAQFVQRSNLPVSAACLVANGVRETLAAVLGSAVSLRLLEPIVPDAGAWAAIASGAHLYGVHGPLADAAFVLRAQDALALAGAAFGEEAPPVRPLSGIESQVLVRALRAIAGCLSPVCGAREVVCEPLPGLRDYTTYFELLFERPAPLRLGIALSREPESKAGPTLRAGDLNGVELELAVEFASGSLQAGALLGLQCGQTVALTTRLGAPGALKIGGRTVAYGECGVLAGRRSLIVR